MQATVYRFDPVTGSGSVITDQGVVLPFEPAALSRSGLRHVRPGQRLTVTIAAPATAGDATPDGADPDATDPDDPGPGLPGRIIQLTLGSIGATLRDQP